MGECSKIHEYALRADYERAAPTRDLYYEIDVRWILNAIQTILSLSARLWKSWINSLLSVIERRNMPNVSFVKHKKNSVKKRHER